MRENTKKRIIAFLLSAGLAVSVVPAGVFGKNAGIMSDVYAQETSISSEYSTFSLEGNVIAEENVEDTSSEKVITQYVNINNISDWNKFAADCNETNDFYSTTMVKLTDDIIFDGVSYNNYSQVGEFRGILDGCGYTISGMIGMDRAGLFEIIDSDAVVRNIVVENSSFDCDNLNEMGVIASSNSGVISNCHIKSTNLINRHKGSCYSGGIAAYNDGTIENCTIASDVVIKSNYMSGGISANFHSIATPKINNSANMGSVSGGTYAGGIAGCANDINNCYNVGKISSGKNMAAGIAYNAQGIVWNCFYSAESSTNSVIKAEQKSNKITKSTDSEMRTQNFCNTINTNRGYNKEWMKWEMDGSSLYPVIIKTVDIKKCEITVPDKVQFTGEELKPKITITNNGKKLKENVDFKVEYSNNSTIGWATANIIGLGAYVNDVQKKFKIIKGDCDFKFIKIKKAYYANGNSIYLNVYATKGVLGVVDYSSSNEHVATVDYLGKITFLKPGKAVIILKAQGTDQWNGKTVKIPITVHPDKPTVKLKAGKRKVKVSYKKVKGATGYEIQYSVRKKFNYKPKLINTKSTSKTIKNLRKGNRYYFRVRAYKKVGKTKLYSKWSKAKNVRVK